MLACDLMRMVRVDYADGALSYGAIDWAWLEEFKDYTQASEK